VSHCTSYAFTAMAYKVMIATNIDVVSRGV